MAVAISNDPIWLREIARNALMYNSVTEDKKAPVESIDQLNERENPIIWTIQELMRKHGIHELPRDEVQSIKDCLKEIASQERNMAIQQAIEIINDKLPFEFKTRFSPDYHEINIALEKLKKDS